MLTKQADKASSRIIEGTAVSYSELWNEIQAMQGGDAVKLVLETLLSRDAVVSSREMADFADFIGALGD